MDEIEFDNLHATARTYQDRRLEAGSLCDRCAHGHIYRRCGALDVAVHCRSLGARVPPDIAECSAFRAATALTLNDECKLILKPNHFNSRESLFDFGKVLRRPARENGVGFDVEGFTDEPLQIREVLFLDTPDFQLYNNAFILRRRVAYKDGFPIGDPEIVFKCRHPDLQKAAEVDVRPRISGDYKIKFKAEALPLKDGLGGIRMLYSHNVEFGLSSIREGDGMSMDTIVRVLPALEAIPRSPGERIELVSGTIVEEVLQDIGVLDFGKGMTAVANVALWRNRGDHSPLIGEFAFQIKFKRREDLNERALTRGEAFFLALQNAARDWIALGATKTGVVYRLKGSPPHAHE